MFIERVFLSTEEEEVHIEEGDEHGMTIPA
jgi:hypothetical protein